MRVAILQSKVSAVLVLLQLQLSRSKLQSADSLHHVSRGRHCLALPVVEGDVVHGDLAAGPGVAPDALNDDLEGGVPGDLDGPWQIKKKCYPSSNFRDCHIMAKILSMVMVSSPIQFNYKNFSLLSLTFG